MERQILIRVNLTQLLAENRDKFITSEALENLNTSELISAIDNNGRLLGKMDLVNSADQIETSEISEPDLTLEWIEYCKSSEYREGVTYHKWLAAQGWSLFRSQVKITAQPKEIEYTLEDVLDAVQYGMAYSQESQHSGFVPTGNILQWLMARKCLSSVPEEFKKYKNS